MLRQLTQALIAAMLVYPFTSNAIEVNALGGINSYSPSLTGASNTTTGSGSSLTYGATIGVGIAPAFGIETGVLSVGKKYDLTQSGSTATIEARAWEIPLLVRFKALPVIDFGLGGYFQHYEKDIDLSSGGISVGSKWTNLGLSRNDYGVKGSVRAKVALNPMLKLFGQADYNLGMKNLVLNTNSGQNYKSRDLMFLGGISVGF